MGGKKKGEKDKNSAAPWSWGAAEALSCSSRRGESTEGTQVGGILFHGKLKGAGKRVKGNSPSLGVFRKRLDVAPGPWFR